MNYRVTLSIFLFFVHVHSAIIGGRSRREDEERLQGDSIQRERHKNLDAVKRFFSTAKGKREVFETEHLSRIPDKNDLSTLPSPDKRKRCTRIFLEPSTSKYNYRVGSSRRFDIHANCQQCRRSQHCTLNENCLPCAQYCKQNDQESFKRKAVQLEDDVLPVKDLEDPGIISRLSENLLQEADSRIRNEEIESLPSQGVDDTRTSIKRMNDQTDEEKLNPGQAKPNVIVGSDNQLEIDEDCDQCRLSNHCEADDNCLPCIPICKPRSFARIPSSEDEVISLEPNNNILPVAGLKDETLTTRLRENSFKGASLSDRATDENNKSIESQAIDDTNISISKKHAENQRNAEEFHAGLNNILRMASVNQFEIQGSCEQCRYSQHCALSDTCLQCAQYCKTNSPTSMRSMSFPVEEGMASDPENNILPVINLKDQPLTSRADDTALGLIEGQEIEDANLPISIKHTEDERNAAEFQAGLNNIARMPSNNQFEIQGNCEQCRHSQHCALSDTCVQCAQYCKSNSPTAMRSMPFPEEDGITGNAENNFLPARNLKDVPLISRAGESSLDVLTDGQDGDETSVDHLTDESIDNQENGDTNIPISRQRFNDPIDTKKFDASIDTRIRTENADHQEFYKNCEECRNFQKCEVSDKCLPCSEYCKIEESFRSNEEVGIARDPENDVVLVENLTDRTLVSRGNEDNLEENASTENFDSKHRPISRENNDYELDFDADLVQKTNEESIDNQKHSKKDTEVGNLGEEKDESRYYLLGMFNSGLLLSILSRLAGIKDHFDIRRNNFEKAIIFVKSRYPIHIKPNIIEKIGDSAFLKILENEINMIEKKQKKSQLNSTQINNIIQIAHEKAEAKYREKEVIDKIENVHERHNEDDVGCSHEQNQELPFYSTPTNLYRSKSIPWTENDHQMEITKPGEPGNSGEKTDIKQAKNPEVIQDNPNVELRSNTPKSLVDMSDSDFTLNSIGTQQRISGSMNLVSSTNDGGYKKYRGIKERVRNGAQFTREQDLAESISSEQESVEKNDRARSFQQESTVQNKVEPNINQIQRFGNSYKHFSRDAIGQDSYESHKNLNEPTDNRKSIHKNNNKISNSERNPGNHIRPAQDMNEHINVRNKNHPNARSSRVDSHRQLDGYEETLNDHNNKFDQQSKPNHNLNKKEPNQIQSQNATTIINESLRGGNIERNMKDTNGLPSVSLRQSENDKNIAHTKPQKYQQTHKYSRMSSSNLEDGGMGDLSNAHINSKIFTTLIDENKLKEELGNGELVRVTQKSSESMESTEIFDKSTKKQPSRANSLNHKIKEQARIYNTDVSKKNQEPSSINSELNSNSDPRKRIQVMNEKTKINGNHRNTVPQEIISTDDHLIDVSQQQKPIAQNENQWKSEATEKTTDNNFGQATTDVGSKFDQHKRFKNVASDEKMPLKNLDVPPKNTHFASNQKMDLTNSQNAKLLKDHMLPSKLSYKTPKAQSIPSAPAFEEKRKIEIDISNYTPSKSHGQDDVNSPLDVEPLTRMNELETSKFDEDPEEIIGDALLDSNNTVLDENINKLITSQEREFLHNFGKIVPASEQLHLSKNSEVYFNGNGIKLPLKVSQSEDGVLTLSVDIEKLCQCKNATCSHKKEFLKQLDKNMGKLFHSPQIPIELHESKEMKRRRSNDPIDLFHSDGYQRKTSRLYKRSIDESSNVNILENHAAKINEKENNIGSKQNLNNTVQESKNNDGENFQNLEDLEKFKIAEKQLEAKLEKLNADVQKSSKYYNNMLQKSTKDLLHIKGEDHVVKQRTELVNDLLKRMKEMADRIATFNKNATVRQ